MTDADPVPGPAPEDEPEESTDGKDGIRDRSVREVVERTRDVIRRTRELLDNSRELLDRVRHRDTEGVVDDAPREHDAEKPSDGAGSE